MSDKTTALLITTGIVGVVLLLCFWGIRRALKRGQISYSGNNVHSPTRTYTRKDSPAGFWIGIGVIVFIAAITILFGSVILLTAVFGIEI